MFRENFVIRKFSRDKNNLLQLIDNNSKERCGNFLDKLLRQKVCSAVLFKLLQIIVRITSISAINSNNRVSQASLEEC